MVIEIPLEANIYSYRFLIDLEDQTYTFELKYNDRSVTWTLNILDADGEPVILGICLLTDVNFYQKYKMENRPVGMITIFDKDNLGRNADIETIGQSVKMNYIESADIEAL